MNEKLKIGLIGLALIIIFGFYFYLAPTVIGYLTLTRELKFNDKINIEIDQNSNYTWIPLNQGKIKSIKLDGNLTLNGTAKVILSGPLKEMLLITVDWKSGKKHLESYAILIQVGGARIVKNDQTINKNTYPLIEYRYDTLKGNKSSIDICYR